eukprot:CAMPEP_0206507976 /NCGR_PEP_ID=MMETSP0324_2-20121206/57965_1 /ASSEMBLY_ACC=CAM_ASM_000836 /TAXON_ID=2866 /ORGANISM="Crypthecodinium cohnii, Strain Seligo" /LENGTH=94 /DNA_ID=CAMNT_0053998567 /DNA_START=1 /DNA_END=286 /DNA_ORIENTATION=-
MIGESCSIGFNPMKEEVDSEELMVHCKRHDRAKLRLQADLRLGKTQNGHQHDSFRLPDDEAKQRLGLESTGNDVLGDKSLLSNPDLGQKCENLL